jgi:hypothetical protein
MPDVQEFVAEVNQLLGPHERKVTVAQVKALFEVLQKDAQLAGVLVRHLAQ